MTEFQTIVTRSNKAKRTKENYLRAVRLFESFAQNRQLNGALVEEWRDHMAKTMSPASVNTNLGAIRYVGRRLAVLHSDERANFAKGTEGLPTRGTHKNPPRVLTVDECLALLDSCDESLIGRRDYAVLQVGLHTGMRRQGLVAIGYDSMEGADITFPVKGGGTITTKLGEDVLDALADTGVNSGRFFRRVSRPDLENRITLGPSISPDGLYKALKKRADGLGIHGFKLHSMRHTFISLAQAAGVPEWRIMAVTGHKLDATLSKIVLHYTHDLDEKPVGDYLPF